MPIFSINFLIPLTDLDFKLSVLRTWTPTVFESNRLTISLTIFVILGLGTKSEKG